MRSKGIYWPIIIPMVIILVMTVVWAFISDNFTRNAKEAHRLSLDPGHFISPVQLEDLRSDGKVLVVDIREQAEFARDHLQGSINIPLLSLLDKSNLSIMKKNEGPVILCSADMAVSASAWALLTQMGLEELYLLELPAGSITNETTLNGSDRYDDEKLRYSFVPDSVVSIPEQEPIE